MDSCCNWLLAPKLTIWCILVLLLLPLWSPPALAQDSLDVDALINSITEGDEEVLLAFAEQRIELALLGQRRRYTIAQAKYVLRDFYNRYPPDAFTVNHSLSQQDEWWLTGSYSISYTGEQMRVYLRFKGRFPVYRLLAVQIVSV